LFSRLNLYNYLRKKSILWKRKQINSKFMTLLLFQVFGKPKIRHSNIVLLYISIYFYSYYKLFFKLNYFSNLDSKTKFYETVLGIIDQMKL